MHPKPISVQLYSLRKEAQTDFLGVLKHLAQTGYNGVESAGMHGMTPLEFRKVVEDLGMVVSSVHDLNPFSMPVQQAIDSAGVLGIDNVIGGFGTDAFDSLDAIKKTAEKVSAMIAQLKPAGIKLLLHNHQHEFRVVEGRLAYDWFAELCPEVLFELDTYWASNFGANDPAVEVAKLKDRIRYLHIKDGPLTEGQPMVAVGQGKMDIPSVIAAANPDVLRWMVVELDECATDMTNAVDESYAYLVNNHLATGR